LIRRGWSLDFSRKSVLGLSALFMPVVMLVPHVPVGWALLLFSIAFFCQQSWSGLIMTNLEHHHFKFEGHRQAGDVHVHFFDAHSLSFGEGIALEDGDWVELRRIRASAAQLDSPRAENRKSPGYSAFTCVKQRTEGVHHGWKCSSTWARNDGCRNGGEPAESRSFR
jgi:hypothetical protein